MAFIFWTSANTILRGHFQELTLYFPILYANGTRASLRFQMAKHHQVPGNQQLQTELTTMLDFVLS